MTDVAMTEETVNDGSDPLQCKWCGRREVNEYCMNINHGPQNETSVRAGQCISQRLLRNHLLYDAMTLLTRDPRGNRRYDEGAARASFEDAKRRAAQFGLDVEALLGELPKLVCAACTAGNHHVCPESTWHPVLETTAPCGCEERHDG